VTRPLYIRFPKDTRLGGPQSRSGRREKNSCPCRELNPGPPTHSSVTTLSYEYRMKTRVYLKFEVTPEIRQWALLSQKGKTGEIFACIILPDRKEKKLKQPIRPRTTLLVAMTSQLYHPLNTYDVSKSFRTGPLERKPQMVQLSVTRCSCIAIFWASLVSFAAIILWVASQQVFIIVDFVINSVRELLDTPSYSCSYTKLLYDKHGTTASA